METQLEIKVPSQKEQLKHHLEKYGWIQKMGQMGSLRLYGIDALGQRCRELVRNEGWNIKTEQHNGNGYAVYILEKAK
jgi:hypothetical protein